MSFFSYIRGLNNFLVVVAGVLGGLLPPRVGRSLVGLVGLSRSGVYKLLRSKVVGPVNAGVGEGVVENFL